jgi:hypothetical protein
VIALWCTTREIINTTGTATIQRYESEKTAVANSITTHGTSNPVRIAVDHAARRTSSRRLGRITEFGHAWATSSAVMAVRATKKPPRATTNTGHDGTYTASHRRSWNTSNGAGALTCGAPASAVCGPRRLTIASSPTARPTATARSTGRSRRRARSSAIGRT